MDVCRNVAPTVTVGEYCVINYINKTEVQVIPLYGNLLVSAYIVMSAIDYSDNDRLINTIPCMGKNNDELITFNGGQILLHKETLENIITSIGMTGRYVIEFGEKYVPFENIL
jgi:hypothetical protein